MTIAQLGIWTMLFFGGLWAGGILIFAVERTNLWSRMPVEQYAVDFRRSVLRVDPMMPILGAISALAAIVVVYLGDGWVRYFAAASVALLVTVILSSILLAEPMNTKFRELPEGEVPKGVADIRDRWRAFHTVRTLLAIAALGCMAATAVA